MDRIGLDLERRGKAERQRGLKTWISPHRRADLGAVGAALRHAELFARTDPLHPGTADEVDALVAAGATVLMLPMFTSAGEVARFVAAVDGRATVVLLLETAQAAARAGEIAAVDGVDEVHVGLNDLTLSLGLPNRFTTLASPLLADVADAVHAAGCPLGVGGLACPDERGLPIPSDLVYASLARLGATGALLARSFLRGATAADLPSCVRQVRERMDDWRCRGDDELAEAREALRRRALALGF